MNENTNETKEKILFSAKKEFLEKGFVNASLRTIVKNAGVTTGALYRHFKDKNNLFDEIVCNVENHFKELVKNYGVTFHKKESNILSKEHLLHEKEIFNTIIEFIYEEYDVITLLLLHSSGSSHEKFLQEMCDIYTNCLLEFVEWLRENNYVKREINNMAVHMVATTMLTAFSEIVIHKMEIQESKKYIEDISVFVRFGFMNMLGMKE